MLSIDQYHYKEILSAILIWQNKLKIPLKEKFKKKYWEYFLKYFLDIHYWIVDSIMVKLNTKNIGKFY